MRELQGTQTVSQPFVQFAEELGCLCQLEIRFPSRHITPQFLRHLTEATPARPAGYLPDAPLEGNDCLVRHTPLDRPPALTPQLLAEKGTTIGAGHRALGFIHLQMEPVVALAQTLKHALTRLATAHVWVEPMEAQSRVVIPDAIGKVRA